MKNFMKYIYLFSGIVFIVGMSMYSCRPEMKPTENNKIDFDTIHTVKNYHINNDSTQPSCNLKLTFVYPYKYENPQILDSLQRIFITCYFDESYTGLSPERAVKSYEENYIENYKEDFRMYAQDRVYEHETSDAYSSYYEIDENKVLFNRGGILSFQVSQINYKGGASSFDILKNYTLDVQMSRLLTEMDIFNEGYEKVLGNMFRDYLLNAKKARSLSELEDLGYFGLDEMVPNGNFLLDDKGITYIFNKGEYSAYKTDAITIFIPYNDIKPLLKENSPIAKFVLI